MYNRNGETFGSWSEINYSDDDFSQGYGQIKEALRCPTEDAIFQPNISQQNFRSSNIGEGGNEVGYSLNVCDIRHEKDITADQTINVEFKISADDQVVVYDFSLVLKKMISIRSIGRKKLDLF